MLGISAFVLVGVTVLLVAGVLLARGRTSERTLSNAGRWTLVVTGGVALPLLAIIALVFSSLYFGRNISAREQGADLTVEIVGKQWWWEVHYLDAEGSRVATTANEIHIPVDQRVRFLLKSDNVLHSFWVPNLQGKTDLVPGRTNETWLRAEEPGTYRGQCAEFCGTQHAFMAFLVIAQPPDRFAAWLEKQKQPSVLAEDPSADAGRVAFTESGCDTCHTVRGTKARGILGPDLTHFASRRTLAAAVLPNTRKQLAEWITGSQSIKPGNKMPENPIPEERLVTLLDYLERLE